MLDIRPSSNDGAENHKPEGEKGRGCDASSEPQNFSVCNDNGGQVLENRVDWDGKELEGFGTSIDHTNEEEGDGKPCEVISYLSFPLRAESYMSLPSLYRKARGW